MPPVVPASGKGVGHCHASRPSSLSGAENEYITASTARDTVERYAYALSFHDIAMPPLDRYRGRRFVDAFLRITEALAEWMDE